MVFIEPTGTALSAEFESRRPSAALERDRAMDYDFTLTFKLNDRSIDEDAVRDRLMDAGCDDALVGLGVAGHVTLDFTRQAGSAEEAMLSAVTDVMRALPEARLSEAGPDFVGLTEVAKLFGQTRQNMRLVREQNEQEFPSPVYSGSTSVWHLAPVLQFLETRNFKFADAVLEVARTAMNLNVAREKTLVDDSELCRIGNRVPFWAAGATSTATSPSAPAPAAPVPRLG